MLNSGFPPSADHRSVKLIGFASRPSCLRGAQDPAERLDDLLGGAEFLPEVEVVHALPVRPTNGSPCVVDQLRPRRVGIQYLYDLSQRLPRNGGWLSCSERGLSRASLPIRSKQRE